MDKDVVVSKSDFKRCCELVAMHYIMDNLQLSQSARNTRLVSVRLRANVKHDFECSENKMYECELKLLGIKYGSK
jgi:hypothetical protein